MILAAAALTLLLGPATAETDTERRVISNAAYLLKSASNKRQNKLNVLSADLAYLAGENGQQPVPIVQTEHCVFEMREQGSYGFRIDFNKLSASYESRYEGNAYSLFEKLRFLGVPGAACELRAPGLEPAVFCYPYLRFNSSPRDFSELIASVEFIQQNGCDPIEPPKTKPRF
jgi:hypothetical protein